MPEADYHEYIHTMVGLCLECHEPFAAGPHVAVRAVVPSMQTSSVPREPGFASIGAQGPQYGKGRGDLTPRQKTWLIGWVGLVDSKYGGGR